MQQIQREDTTRRSQLGRNYIHLLLVINYCKDLEELRATWLNGFYFPYEMENQRICNLGINAI
jgi:hypothetical protein